MKTFDQIREAKGFTPHMMYDPKTGKGHKADKLEDHLRMKKMGYTHEKPDVKEQAVNELDTSTLVSYRKKANKQRYSNNISKRTQRTAGVDRADKKLRKRNIDKFGDHSPKGVDRMGNRKEDSSDAVPERKSTRESVVWEAIDPKMQKVKQLARLGLVNKMDITRLIRAMKSIETGERVAEKDRKVIFSAFGDLVDIITGDTTIFTKTRKAVQKEEVELDEGKFKDMVIRKQDKAMGAKPVPQPKKEARVIDPKAMSAYQKYAKAKRVDDDSIRMAYDNPDHPETKRMMKNKSFATALKMYKAAGK